MQPKKIATLIRDAALDKKCEDPVILDVAKLTSVSHYFVITHGNSGPHVKAIASHITEEMKKVGVKLFHCEGLEDAKWVLLDFGVVLVHIFYHETREFYSLERLWGEAISG